MLALPTSQQEEALRNPYQGSGVDKPTSRPKKSVMGEKVCVVKTSQLQKNGQKSNSGVCKTLQELKEVFDLCHCQQTTEVNFC